MEKPIRRKKVILTLCVILVAFLLVCTLVSQSVYRALLPVVETVKPANKGISYNAEAAGTLHCKNQSTVYAKGNWRIGELLCQPGETLTSGKPAFTVETDAYPNDEKNLKLKLLQAKQSLESQGASEASKEALRLQLKIAENEWADYQNGIPGSQDEIAKLQAQLDARNAKSALEAGKLSAQVAEEELAAYRVKGAGYDRAAAAELRSQILKIGMKLRSPSLPEDERAELLLVQSELQQQLTDLSAQFDGYDPVQEQRLRLAALQALSKVEDSEYGKSALEIQSEIAQLQLDSLQKGDPLQGQKLRLAVDKAKEALAAGSGGVQAAQLQVQIAGEQLDQYRAAYPADGNIGVDGGVLAEWLVRPGDLVKEGEPLAYLTTEQPQYAVEWELSQDAGSHYGAGDSVSLSYRLATERNKIAVTGTIKAKSWNGENQSWRFEAEADGLGKQPPPIGSPIRVGLAHTEKASRYLVVPLSCVQTEGASGTSYVYCVRSRDGLFSQEFYLVKTEAKVVESNALYAAIDGEVALTDDIVRYASKPVYDQAIVSVVE